MWKAQVLILNRQSTETARKLREFEDPDKGIRNWRGKTSDGYQRVTTRISTVEINLRLDGQYAHDSISMMFWALQRVWDRYEQANLEKPRGEVRCKVQWKVDE